MLSLRAARTMEGECAPLSMKPGHDRRRGSAPDGGAVNPIAIPIVDRKLLISPGSRRGGRGGGAQSTARRQANTRRIRSDLLHKLGIDEAVSKGKSTEKEMRMRNPDRSLLGDMPVFREALKYDATWEEELDATVRQARIADGGGSPPGSWQDNLANLFAFGGGSSAPRNAPTLGGGSRSAPATPPGTPSCSPVGSDSDGDASISSQPATADEALLAARLHPPRHPLNRKRLVFRDTVAVVPIPMRTE